MWSNMIFMESVTCCNLGKIQRKNFIFLISKEIKNIA